METARCVFWFDKADEAPNTGEYIECWLRTIKALMDDGLKIEFAFGSYSWEKLVGMRCKGKGKEFGVEDIPTMREMIIYMCKEMEVY